MRSKLVLILVVVGVALILHRASQEQMAQVQGDSISTDATPTPSEVAATPSATVTTAPATKLPLPVKPSPTKTQVSQSDWQYPGSAVVGNLKWRSSDSAEAVTNWYEKKITDLGMSAKSFAKTNANDKVLNKLVAVSNSLKVKVDISQQSASSPVEIVVVLDN